MARTSTPSSSAVSGSTLRRRCEPVVAPLVVRAAVRVELVEEGLAGGVHSGARPRRVGRSRRAVSSQVHRRAAPRRAARRVRGAGDRRGDARLGQQPGDRDRGDRDARARRRPRPARRAPPRRARRGSFDGRLGARAVAVAAVAVLAGQEAAGERVVRRDGQPVLGHDRRVLALVALALDEVVVRLQPRVRRQPLALGDLQRLRQPLAAARWTPRRSGTLPSRTSSSNARTVSSTGTDAVVLVGVVEVDAVGLQALAATRRRARRCSPPTGRRRSRPWWRSPAESRLPRAAIHSPMIVSEMPMFGRM